MVMSARQFYSGNDGSTDRARESEFFAKLKMRNGTFKLTQPSRFRELEIAFRPVLSERAAQLRDVLDVGVSTGVTTVELLRYLETCGSTPKVTATDLFIDAHIVEVATGVRVLADPEGWPLQYDVAGLAIRPWIRRLDYVSLAFIPRQLAKAMLQPRLRALIRSGKSEPVQMITRSLSRNDSIEFVEDDIMRRSPDFTGRFDLVRAANILNKSYFSAEQICSAVANIRSYLKGRGSLLIVTRTNEKGENRGTIFEVGADGSFAALMRVGGGSEVEDLILGHQEP
ncbi:MULTISPECIES: ATP-binding protein [unclassified Ensifer]|uniref:ATP-binding protein n=1 Tax=unclassified Ensifer TaxID=2633371 RepID=UPI0008132E56|nr:MULTISPECIES: ATP-binding protein [unclassified Ensifer]OCP10176.1 ATP-binding protein [Ensifer sp. LC14]OCP12303.1 ATP-binding protein [Ensifer sp. LC13]OCP13122.1 ATP-binding protein [Ensifer sp. LC11]OCP33865.1 ATP-binding protein [Ensifer sp. LC499]